MRGLGEVQGGAWQTLTMPGWKWRLEADVWSSTSARLDGLICEAESRRACITANNPADAQMLKRMVRREELVSPAKGIYARTEVWARLDPAQRAERMIRGLAKVHPGWVFCKTSAAVVQGLSVSWRDLFPLCAYAVTPPPGGEVSGVSVGRLAQDVTVEVVDGVRVTSRERTVFDCLRTLPFRGGLVVADSWLRRDDESGELGYGPIAGCELRAEPRSREELLTLVESMPSCRGVAQARITASFANGAAENGGESDARAVMIEEGYQVPELQIWVSDPIDGRRFRCDFRWRRPDGVWLLGEFDGSGKYTDAAMTGGATPEAVRQAERLRESRIASTEQLVMRFGARDLEDRARFRRIMDHYGVPLACVPAKTTASPRTWTHPLGLRSRTVRLGDWQVSYQVRKYTREDSLSGGLVWR